MWTKTDRFVFSVGIYNYLINPNIDTKTIIDWPNIIENSIYSNPKNELEKKELEEINLVELAKARFQKFLDKQEFYQDQIGCKLQKIRETPELVIAILISFCIEEEEIKELESTKEIEEKNFSDFSQIVKSYSRMTQDLIGTDYMMLVNSIIRNKI